MILVLEVGSYICMVYAVRGKLRMCDSLIFVLGVKGSSLGIGCLDWWMLWQVLQAYSILDVGGQMYTWFVV